ncbi:hypothetical protein V6N13_056678 [Hibiscus sabdariffa]
MESSDATSSDWSLFTSSDEASFTAESARDSFTTVDHDTSNGDPILIELLIMNHKLGKKDVIIIWEDTWCGSAPLKLQFPWLFRLARRKCVVVMNLSVNNDFLETTWEDEFTRTLLDRERNMLADLLQVLREILVNSNVEDRLIWIHDRVSNFLVKLLSSLLIQTEMDIDDLNAD